MRGTPALGGAGRAAALSAWSSVRPPVLAVVALFEVPRPVKSAADRTGIQVDRRGGVVTPTPRTLRLTVIER